MKRYTSLNCKETPCSDKETATSAENFRILFDSLPCSFLFFDINLKILSVNKTLLAAAASKAGGMLRVLLDNQGGPDATGFRNLRASLKQALVMPWERKDVTSGPLSRG